MLKNGATIVFNDGSSIDVDRVMFKDNGWIGYNDDGNEPISWEYHPPNQIRYVASHGSDRN